MRATNSFNLAVTLVEHGRRLTIEIDELVGDTGERVHQVALSRLAILGCAALSAAKIIGETAGVDRFRSSSGAAAPIAIDPVRNVADEREAGPTLRRLRKEADLALREPGRLIFLV
ncbi:hypothetical protein [Nocardia vinacea]|uniref:hypothetical protein n=1 Tax=Nocardia vinacea TaxID=96468 RepID=UPI003F4DE56B